MMPLIKHLVIRLGQCKNIPSPDSLENILSQTANDMNDSPFLEPYKGVPNFYLEDSRLNGFKAVFFAGSTTILFQSWPELKLVLADIFCERDYNPYLGFYFLRKILQSKDATSKLMERS